MTKVVAILLGAAAVSWGLAVAGDAQVYKSVDAQGNVVYTDKPSTQSASKTAVRVHEPSAEDTARVEQQRQASQAAELQRLKDTVADRANRAREQQQKQQKQIRCQNARNRFYALKDATHIYERDAQGNRVYLPDDAADARRAEARKAMDAACAP